MFDFLEKLIQPQVEAFERNPGWYIIIGIIISLVWLFGKNSRRREMRKFAKEMNLSFQSYAIQWDLLPILTPLYKGYNIGFPINFIEGKIGEYYYVIFDFYYRKWNFINQDVDGKLITFVNGKYFKNCSVIELKQAIADNNFSGLILGDETKEYLRFREVAVLNTYGNIKLKNSEINQNDTERVINAFRSINYGSFLGKMEDGMLTNKLNADTSKSADEVENKLKLWQANISRESIEIIIEAYLNILNFHTADDIIKNININKLK